MVVEKGYKQTEIGVIPENWNSIGIQDLINNNFIVGHLDGNHGALYPRSNEFIETGVPYIGANDFYNGRVLFSNCKYLSLQRASVFRKGIAIDGDVLFAHNATVGPVALLRTNFDFVILSTTATYFRCNSDKILNLYLLYFLQSQNFIKQFSAVMAQSTRNQIPITAQRKLNVILPPLPEQTAIANALSDMDALIAQTEKLIEKKKAIKQGVMQELLKPKEGWGTKKLGDYGKTYGGITGKTKSDFGKGNGNYIPFMNIMSNPIIDIGYLDKVDIKSSESQNRAVKGDLFFNGSSETPEEVGLCSVLTEELDNLYLNSFCFGYRMNNQNDLNGLFLSYLFRSPLGRNLIFSLAQGATRYNLSKTNLLKLELPIPSKKEQDTIAMMLLDLDRSITATQTKLTKLKHQKQGMMQALLTGKIRLI